MVVRERHEATVRACALWPERDTLPAENCAFVPPMTVSRAMVRRSGGSGKGKVGHAESGRAASSSD